MRIYLAAWPRSGTKHLGRMIAAALGENFVVGLPLSRGGRQPDNLIPAVCQTHFSANHGKNNSGDLFFGPTVLYNNLRADEHLIWNVRDPRDTAVSLWQIGLRGEWIPPCTLAEYLESYFCAEVLNAPDFGPSVSWQTYTRGWMELADDPLFIWARHESTMENREAQLIRLLSAMGYSVSQKNIRRAIAPELGRMRLSYDGEDNFMLAGHPEWMRHFGPAEAHIIDHYCGSIMKELDYGNEPRWKELLSRKVVQ